MNQIDTRLKPKDWKPPLIAAIGVGIGPQCLGPLALEWISEAQVLAGGSRHLELVPEYAGEKLPLKSPLSESLEEIARISATKRIAVLCSGDPMFFGIGSTLADRFGRERLVVVPNITSVQALCARVCESLDKIDTVSFHGRKGETGIGRVLDSLACGRKVAVITDPEHMPQWIARELARSPYSECKLTIGEDLGAPTERVRSFSPSDAADEEFSPLNVILVQPAEHVIKPDKRVDPGRIFGFGEEEFEREAGMITKMEVRAVALALLQPGPGQTLWDIGAGTGSVSIEAARIARLDRVFAVEKNRSRYIQPASKSGEIRRIRGAGSMLKRFRGDRRLSRPRPGLHRRKRRRSRHCPGICRAEAPAGREGGPDRSIASDPRKSDHFLEGQGFRSIHRSTPGEPLGPHREQP